MRTWNNIGKVAQLGEPDLPSDPAPSVVLNRPSGLGSPLIATLQGIIIDNASVADRRASITNAVILSVVEL